MAAAQNQPIDFSDIPEITPEQWEQGNAIVFGKDGNQFVFDPDVYRWFRRFTNRRGQNTELNKALKAYMQTSTPNNFI